MEYIFQSTELLSIIIVIIAVIIIIVVKLLRINLL